MSLATKVKTLSLVTLLMGTGFYFMSAVPVARGVLAVVWLAHLYYFGFRVKTTQTPPDTGENPDKNSEKQEETPR